MGSKKQLYMLSLILVSIILYFLYRGQRESPYALQRIGWWSRPYFKDDSDKRTLLAAIERNKRYLKSMPPYRQVSFGREKYSVKEIIESYDHFVSILKRSKSNREFNRRIADDFSIYQPKQLHRDRGVLFTGYYEPVLRGSRKRTDIFRFPIYKKPDDLIKIELGLFRRNLMGRYIIAKIENGMVVPYDDRETIDAKGSLKGNNLEIAWLSNPIDPFFLQIQGSGVIELEEGGTINVNYHTSNGREYRSIGKILISEGKISKKEMSMMAIRRYLSAHPKEINRILNYNKSYVFFKTVDEGPIGSTGVPMTPGRSIAADSRIFPKGGLVYIETEIPVTDREGNIISWKSFFRFAVDQDSGGAIKGPNRIDIFFGTGKQDGFTAGAMNRRGKIYYLIKKKQDNQ